ncbi:MAG: hypothetical protein QOE39_3319 [Bradyrhizobium sp.]|jgi:hypothetical protein|nr:hypothetical protein [Bradyrhizobium sp.]
MLLPGVAFVRRSNPQPSGGTGLAGTLDNYCPTENSVNGIEQQVPRIFGMPEC